MSHKAALDVLLKKFVAIIDTLEVIKEKIGDRKAGSEAGGFLNYLLSIRFVYTAFCFKILLQILRTCV